jgi:NAD(P)-dependent dehydrogenase (short-subunit alcohol dehydrogenase family)
VPIGTGEFEGKVALVTGAASGIGRASARAFARHGAAVLVCDVDEAGGHETVELISAAGGTGAFQLVDVSREADVIGAVDAAVQRYGQLDFAHNNAGVVGLQARIEETSLASWESVMDVNLTGVFLCLKYEIAHMASRGSGAIVNTASISGLGASPMMVAYTASKHGVVGLTRVVAYDYAARGIRINAICPGVTRTPMMEAWIGGDPAIEALMDASEPIGRMATADEMADATIWLCSERSSFVTGIALPVDGGLTALAGGGATDD